MSRPSALMTTLGSAAAIAALACAAPAQAAGVSAKAGLQYTVKGQSVTFTPTLTGTQHTVVTEPDGKEMALGDPLTLSLDYGDGSMGTGGDSGAVSCTDHGATPLRFKAPTSTHTYAKPGTYTVTVKAAYCGDGGERQTVNTTKITVGSTGTTAHPSKPKGPKIDTDLVAQPAGGSNVLGLGAGLGVIGADLGAGALAYRARRQH